MKPHKHAEVIKAWADGEQIQWQNSMGQWKDFGSNENPAWEYATSYRVKPEIIRYRVALFKDAGDVWTSSAKSQEAAVGYKSSRFFVRWLTDWIEVEA